MTRRIQWTRKAVADMSKLDAPTRHRVLQAVEALCSEGKGEVRRLRGGSDEWRLRVGDWRVRFSYDASAGAIVVLRVLHRSRAYRDL